MELRQLKYFIKTAEALNFSEAAKACCVTQSTLSQQVKQLETELDTPLLIRTSHRVTLTEAGAELLPYARRTVEDAEKCVDRIADLKSLLCGTLNIGVTYSFGPILTETLSDFMKLYPNVKLNVFYRPMAELMEMLSDHTIDFALAFRPGTPPTDLVSHVLFQNYLAVIVSENHSLASANRISLQQLSRFPLALPAKGLQARNSFDTILQSYPTDLNIKIELNEVNLLLRLIRQGSLVSVLSEATIHNERGVKAIPIDVPGNEMAGCVHTLRDSYRKRSMKVFIKMLGESMAVRDRQNAWL